MYTIEPDRLLKEELEYEISLRGVQPQGTVKDLVKTLRELLKFEADGVSFKIDNKFKSDSELKICLDKIKDIEVLLKETFTQSLIRKLKTRLTHLVTRVQRIEPSTDEETLERSNLLTSVFKLLTDFNTKQDNFSKTPVSNVPSDLAFQQSMLGQSSQPSISLAPQANSTLNNFETTPTQNSQLASNFDALRIDSRYNFKSWGIKFTGKNDMLSLNAFFERIDDLCTARGVSKENLYKAAFEFFEGEALVYYRAVRHKASDWDSLANLFREEFFRDGDKKIWEQIKSRTQGETESIAIYVAYILNLFNRLSFSVNESMKLEIIRERIRPEYQSRLELIDNIDTLDRLIDLGRKIEDSRRKIGNFVPPTTNKNAIELDLEYKRDKDQFRKKLDNIELEKSVTFDYRSRDSSLSSINSEQSKNRPNSRSRSISFDRKKSRNSMCSDISIKDDRVVKNFKDNVKSSRDNNNYERYRDRDEVNQRASTSRDFDRHRDFSRNRNFSRNRDFHTNRDFSRDRDSNRNFDRHRDFSITRDFRANERDLSRNRNYPTYNDRNRLNDRNKSNDYSNKNFADRNITCFKCNGPNHFAKNCRSKAIKCYTCGLKGFTRNTCPTCQGNARRSQM